MCLKKLFFLFCFLWLIQSDNASEENNESKLFEQKFLFKEDYSPVLEVDDCFWHLANESPLSEKEENNEKQDESYRSTSYAKHKRKIENLAVLKDGRVASASWDGTVCLWNIETGEPTVAIEREEGGSGYITSLAVLKDGLLVAGSTRGVWFFDPVTNTTIFDKPICVRIGPLDGINGVIRLKSNVLVLSSYTSELLVIDPVKNNVRRLQCSDHGYYGWVSHLAALDENRFLTSHRDSVVVWDIDTDESKVIKDLEWMLMEDGFDSVAVLNDDLVALGISSRLYFPDYFIELIDMKNRNTPRVLRGHTNSINCMSKLKLDQLVSGSYDKTLKIWDIKSGQLLSTLVGHQSSICSLIEHPSGAFISGDDGGVLKIWRPVEQEKYSNEVFEEA